MALLTSRPIIVDGGSSGHLGAGWGAGWGAHEDWRKYGWESREEYLNNQWRFKNAGFVDNNAIGIGGHSEFFTTGTISSIALSEAFLGEYYAAVSTFLTANNIALNST